MLSRKLALVLLTSVMSEPVGGVLHVQCGLLHSNR